MNHQLKDGYLVREKYQVRKAHTWLCGWVVSHSTLAPTGRRYFLTFKGAIDYVSRRTR